MRNGWFAGLSLLMLIGVAVWVVLALPVDATHTHPVAVNYVTGGTAHADDVWLGYTSCGAGVLGMTLVDYQDTLGGCIGGGQVFSDHYDPDLGDEEQDFSQGYTQGIGVANDALSGPNVGFELCFQNAPEDDNFCDTDNDIRTIACAAAVTVDTLEAEDLPGFRVVEAVTFVRIVYVDSATNEVCLGSSGFITVTFDA